MPEPHWIDRNAVQAIHAIQITRHGGDGGTRDSGLLDSALARPKHRWKFSAGEATLAELAASLTHGIAKNHPFSDGNKRTAWVACRTFLIINGADIIAPQLEKTNAMLALAAGELSEVDFASWLQSHLVEV